VRESGTERALVLDVEGPTLRAANLLADRFPLLAYDAREVVLGIDRGDTPEAILACCRERGIGVRASLVRVRPAGGAASPNASASPFLWEVGQ
jgi:hypothetical protein